MTAPDPYSLSPDIATELAADPERVRGFLLGDTAAQAHERARLDAEVTAAWWVVQVRALLGDNWRDHAAAPATDEQVMARLRARLADQERERAEAESERARADRELRAVREVLDALGADSGRDAPLPALVELAIADERQRREDALTAVAHALGHSRDHTRTMTFRQVVSAVRDAAVGRDRCGDCPWRDRGVGIECGGAAGICPGNRRADLDTIIGTVRDGIHGPGPGTLDEPWATR